MDVIALIYRSATYEPADKDYVIGVYSSEAKAEAAKRRFLIYKKDHENYDVDVEVVRLDSNQIGEE